eukprot:10455776-Alexandrium_andersonii.AAC.1
MGDRMRYPVRGFPREPGAFENRPGTQRTECERDTRTSVDVFCHMSEPDDLGALAESLAGSVAA